MSGLSKVVSVLIVAILAGACSSITGSDDDAAKSKVISSAAQAQSVFALLKASAEAVDRQVAVPFNGSTSVSGSGGSAAVSGKKTSSSSSSSSSSSTSRLSDLQITFASFGSAQGAVSGNVRWFDSYYSRTACSSSFCSSASDHSESIKGSALHIRLVQNGETIEDDITVDASSPDYTARWDVKITNRAGQVFSFTAY